MVFLEDHASENLLNQLKLIQKTANTFADSHLLKEHLKVIRNRGMQLMMRKKKLGYAVLLHLLCTKEKLLLQ
jgi:IclR family KDG regulon transcriptional repressor